MDGVTAQALGQHFVECVAAPEFATEAEAALRLKRNLRALRVDLDEFSSHGSWELRLAGRWALLQRDGGETSPAWRTVTRRDPSPEELEAMRFAWEVAAAARSNAVVLARGTAL